MLAGINAIWQKKRGTGTIIWDSLHVQILFTIPRAHLPKKKKKPSIVSATKFWSKVAEAQGS